MTSIINALYETLKIHLTLQIKNTTLHLLLGFSIGMILLLIFLKPKTAIIWSFMFSFLREFAYQLPLKDHWKLKIYDRILDATEVTVGACAAVLVAYLIFLFHLYCIKSLERKKP